MLLNGRVRRADKASTILTTTTGTANGPTGNWSGARGVGGGVLVLDCR